MPVLIGELEKITGSPSSVTQVMVRAHKTRITGAALTTDELVPIPVGRQGRFEVPLRPGKAVLVLVHGGRVGEGERFPMLVEEGMGTIVSAIKLASDRFDDYELDELERAAADMLASLDKSLVAATRAEVAKEDAEKARDKAGEHRDDAQKAAGTAAADAATSAVQKADEKLAGYVTAAEGHAEDSKDSATSAGKDAGRAEAARQGAETIQQGLPDKIDQELEKQLPGELETRVPAELDKHLPGELEERVPPLVASSIADDRAVADAAAAAVEGAVDEAMPTKADTTYVDAADEALGKRITDEKWIRPPLPDGTDLDTVRASGMHPITTAALMASMANRPSGANGTGGLIVRNVQNTVFQELWWWTSSGMRKAYRVTSSGEFGAWEHGAPKHSHEIADVPGLKEALEQSTGGESWMKPPPENGTDFDTMRTSGAYPVESAAAVATMVNRPPGANGTGVLIVYASGPTVFQEFLWWTSDGVRGHAHRVTSGGVFNPWQVSSDDSSGGSGKDVPSGVISPKEKHFTVDGRLAPVLTDTTRITGWGSSSLGNMRWEFVAIARDLGVEYYSAAKGGEKIEHIAARMGAVPAIIDPVTIPASGSVIVTSPNLPPNLMMQPFQGWLDGVHGTLSSSASAMTFTRTTPGDPVTTFEPTQLVTDIDPSLLESVTLISAGKNNVADANAVERVLDYTGRMSRHLTPLMPRFLVMGHYFNQDWEVGDPRRDRTDAINRALAKTYGDFYIDHHGILMDPGVWELAGITPTDEDLAAQQDLRLPPTLSVDPAHQNNTADLVVTDAVRQRMADLGWY